MTDALKLGFSPFATPTKGVLVVFCDDSLNFGAATKKALGSAADAITRAAKAERFTNNEAANKLLSYKYRAPYKLPA